MRRRQRVAYVSHKGKSINEEHRRHLLTDDTALNSSIDFLDGIGYKPFQEQDVLEEEDPKKTTTKKR